MINGTASLVEAVSTIQKECKSTGHYKIQFVSCSCADVDRNERKKIMKNHRQKQDYEAMEPSKKKIFLEKKQVRDMTNTKHELKRFIMKITIQYTKNIVSCSCADVDRNERKKNYEKSQTETRLRSNGTIKEKNILRKETSEGYDKY